MASCCGPLDFTGRPWLRWCLATSGASHRLLLELFKSRATKPGSKLSEADPVVEATVGGVGGTRNLPTRQHGGALKLVGSMPPNSGLKVPKHGQAVVAVPGLFFSCFFSSFFVFLPTFSPQPGLGWGEISMFMGCIGL